MSIETARSAAPADSDTARQEDPRRTRQGLPWLAAALVAIAVVLAAAGWALLTPRTVPAPAQTSPEVGFARDMFVHHEQAVTMAFLIRDATDDPDIRTLALDTIRSQAEQQGMMLAWLDAHDVPAPGSTWESMAWMDAAPTSEGGHGAEHGSAHEPAATATPETRMGMATDAELSELARLDGTQAEILFLQLMTRHHMGGVQMAQAFLAASDEEQLGKLAQAIVTGQKREMTIMRDLLSERGAIS